MYRTKITDRIFPVMSPLISYAHTYYTCSSTSRTVLKKVVPNENPTVSKKVEDKNRMKSPNPSSLSIQSISTLKKNQTATTPIN